MTSENLTSRIYELTSTTTMAGRGRMKDFGKILERIEQAIELPTEELTMQAVRKAVDAIPIRRRRLVGKFHPMDMGKFVCDSKSVSLTKLLIDELGMSVDIELLTLAPGQENEIVKIPLIFASISLPELMPLVRFLVERQVNLRVHFNHDDILTYAVFQPDFPLDLIKLLVEAGACVNGLIEGGRHRPLVVAMIRERFDIAYYLREKGADPWLREGSMCAYDPMVLMQNKNAAKIHCIMKGVPFVEDEIKAIDQILYLVRWNHIPDKEMTRRSVELFKKVPLDYMRVKFLRRAVFESKEWDAVVPQDVDASREEYYEKLLDDRFYPIGIRLYAVQVLRHVLGEEMPIVSKHALSLTTGGIPVEKRVPTFLEFIRLESKKPPKYRRQDPLNPSVVKALTQLIDDQEHDDYWQHASEEIFLYLGDVLEAKKSANSDRELNLDIFELVLQLYEQKYKHKRPDSRFGRAVRYFLQNMSPSETRWVQQRCNERYKTMLPHLKAAKRSTIPRPLDKM